mmetsp:Transcript_23209/g.36179  ORF Transcript_23209/g.36179 Transcript_23209/m.36179 type:complete len:193 (-) Transcript_23209:6-584(-)
MDVNQLPENAEMPIRARVVREIVITETYFLESVETLTTIFKPILSKYVPPELYQELYRIIDGIVKFARVMLEGIRRRLEHWDTDETCIGDIMVKALPLMKLYTPYPRLHEIVCTKLDQLPAEAKKEIREFQHKGMCVQSYLIMPVARIPRYVLLMSELQKRTPEEHPDQNYLPKVVDALRAICQEMHEARKR